MRGAAERERRGAERDVALAWWVENIARADELRPLKHYLDQLKPKKPQSAEDVLAVFREHQARGAPIVIRKLEPGEE